MIQQFDVVRIITTRNVSYLSADPSDSDVSPHGLWTVTSVIGEQLLITKGKVSVLIPFTDVLLHSKYSLDRFLESLRKGLESGQEKT